VVNHTVCDYWFIAQLWQTHSSLFSCEELLSQSLDDLGTTRCKCFRKNSMGFSVRLDYLLILLYKWLYPYYYTVTCPSRTFYNHMIVIMWYNYLISHAIYILTLLYVLMLGIKMCGNSFLSGALIIGVLLGDNVRAHSVRHQSHFNIVEKAS